MVFLISILYSFNIYAHKHKAFDDAMQHQSFKVKVSNKNLASMHETSTLLISCVDFRLRDETEALMSKNLKLLDDYDEVALPGASLAVVTKQKPHWVKTSQDVIAILKKLHHIKRVVFLDHRGCGAYNLILGKENLDTKEKETALHAKVLAEATKAVKKQFPDIEVYSLLMGLDGVVENMSLIKH
jgi:carbonic anhydrase